MAKWHPTVSLLILLLAFSNVESESNGITSCDPADVGSGTATLVTSFTTTECPMSNTNESCFDECLSPSINLIVGMIGSALCSLPRNSSNNNLRVNIIYYPPNGNQCFSFQMETVDSWLQFKNHILFRKNDKAIEILIVNASEEFNNVRIVCMRSMVDGEADTCNMTSENNTATIYVLPTSTSGESTSSPTNATTCNDSALTNYNLSYSVTVLAIIVVTLLITCTQYL